MSKKILVSNKMWAKNIVSNQIWANSNGYVLFSSLLVGLRDTPFVMAMIIFNRWVVDLNFTWYGFTSFEKLHSFQLFAYWSLLYEKLYFHVKLWQSVDGYQQTTLDIKICSYMSPPTSQPSLFKEWRIQMTIKTVCKLPH